MSSFRAFWLDRRRTPWDRKLILLPFLAASLALYLWARPLPAPIHAEPVEGVQGVSRDGSAFECQLGKRPDISEACIFMSRERR